MKVQSLSSECLALSQEARVSCRDRSLKSLNYLILSAVYFVRVVANWGLY